ncbi:hypothetical protein DPMN_044984 [Dreissena polymorpha]|uniref:Uncharacterized protein n=1 Tax=Dreissena polymorpha TaxID=45954 RepID=A0A9D4D5F1_DREPO|nr:hypothetical protein DPMN_044984 [Dreissena polymorpha]
MEKNNAAAVDEDILQRHWGWIHHTKTSFRDIGDGYITPRHPSETLGMDTSHQDILQRHWGWIHHTKTSFRDIGDGYITPRHPSETLGMDTSHQDILQRHWGWIHHTKTSFRDIGDGYITPSLPSLHPRQSLTRSPQGKLIEGLCPKLDNRQR